MGKWLLKNLKLTTRIKNKTWTNSQIKNQKMRQKSEHRHDTEIQNTCTYILTIITPSVQKIANLHGFKSIYKPRNINVVFSQCGS